VAGVHDHLLTPDYLRQEIVQRISGARLVLIDSGHEIPMERPTELAAVIEAFVAGLGTDRRQ
jgi:pimeloyl-ACP methyl ester carboxylesterase